MSPLRRWVKSLIFTAGLVAVCGALLVGCANQSPESHGTPNQYTDGEKTFNVVFYIEKQLYTWTVVDNGKTVAKPKFTETKDGLFFTGWHSDSLCTVLFDFSRPITEDTFLYAGFRTYADVISEYLSVRDNTITQDLFDFTYYPATEFLIAQTCYFDENWNYGFQFNLFTQTGYICIKTKEALWIGGILLPQGSVLQQAYFTAPFSPKNKNFDSLSVSGFYSQHASIDDSVTGQAYTVSSSCVSAYNNLLCKIAKELNYVY